MRDVVRAVLRGCNLLQDDVFLTCEFRCIEARVAQNVSDNIDCEWHIILQDACVVSRGLEARRGIQFTACRFDLFGDLFRRAPGCPLEGHMLQQM